MSENWLTTNESIQELLDNYKSAPYSRASMYRLMYACVLVVIIGFIGWAIVPDGTIISSALDFIRLFACILEVIVFIKFKLYKRSDIQIQDTENIQEIIVYINNQPEGSAFISYIYNKFIDYFSETGTNPDVWCHNFFWTDYKEDWYKEIWKAKIFNGLDILVFRAYLYKMYQDKYHDDQKAINCTMLIPSKYWACCQLIFLFLMMNDSKLIAKLKDLNTEFDEIMAQLDSEDLNKDLIKEWKHSASTKKVFDYILSERQKKINRLQEILDELNYIREMREIPSNVKEGTK